MRYKKNIGDGGEELAVIILENTGYRIMERNFRTKMGEIDIIAEKCNVIHFIEVKTRTQTIFGYPSESVTRDKQMRIRRAAELYININHLYDATISIDVMEINANFIKNCI